MTYILWVAGMPALEFVSKLDCAYVAKAVMATYHAPAVCMMAIGA